MKPIKLEIEGLHSFEKNQVIDFRTLSSRGVFGIFGATGSGKSTILDAIVLALYGKVQRSKTNSDFINLKSKKAVVSFEFSFLTDGQEKIFLVSRTFKRKPKNNFEVDQVAEVLEVGAFGRRQVMEGVSKVDSFITNLLGLSDVEFLKCIALPQGEFASFLKAKPNERVNIIGNIFDLNKYGQQLWEKVRAKTEEFENRCRVIEGKMSVIGEVDAEKLAQNKTKLSQLGADIASKKKRLEELSKTEKEEREVARLGEELEKIEQELKNYEELLSSMDVKKEALKRAKKLSANKFVFVRMEELAKLILDEQDEVFRKTEALNSLKTRSEKFYADATIELEEIKSKTEGQIAKLERLKSLRTTEIGLIKNKKRLEELNQDLLIVKNKVESLFKKIANTRVERGLKVADLKKIEQEISDLKTKLKGYDSILIFNSLSQYVEELKTYKTYIEEKHFEAVQAMTSAINNKTAYEKQRDEFKANLKLIHENEGIKGTVEDAKVPELLEKAYKDYTGFARIKGMIETLEVSRLEIESEICAHNNKMEQLDVEKARIDFKISELDSEILEIKSKIQQVVIDKEKALSNNGLFDVIARTKIGDNCPVCRSEVLQKAIPDSIDIMVMDDEYSSLNEVLARKMEAKENLIYSIAKVVERIESTARSLEELKTRQEGLKKKTLKLFELEGNEIIIDVEGELKTLEESYLTKINHLSKVAKKEKQLLVKIREVSDLIIKQNCVCATSRMEIDNYGQLLNRVSDSIKAKDMEILSLVSVGEDIDKKTQELEMLNVELEQKLQIQDEDLLVLAELDSQIVKLETELAITQKEESELKEKIEGTQTQVKESEIIINAETSNSDVEATISKLQAEFAGLKYRETELNNLISEQKNEVVKLSTELNSIQTSNNAHMDEHKSLSENMKNLLNELGVDNTEEAKLFIMSDEEVDHLEYMIENFNNNYAFAKTKKSELQKALAGRVSSFVILDQLSSQIATISKELSDEEKEFVRLELNLGADEEREAKLALLKQDFAKADKDYNLAKELYDCLKGKALMEFIAEEFIDDIAFMASNKLQILMDGRYVLKYENKEFFVIDYFNDASVRPVSTLSGGELFVVSLALALSISDAIASKSNKNIGFFFLDEGFGTLDREYCEYIVESLIKLESQNLIIGLISHIPELQERIAQKIEVVKTASGSIVNLKTDI